MFFSSLPCLLACSCFPSTLPLVTHLYVRKCITSCPNTRDIQIRCLDPSGPCQSFVTGLWTHPSTATTLFQMSSATLSRSCPASITTHRSSPISSPICAKICRTLVCTSCFSYLSSPYPPRCMATFGLTSRNRVRSGAGRPTSGALHHSYVRFRRGLF